MLRKINLLLAIVATLGFSNLALAQTVVRLNTGFNHSPIVQAKYPIGVADDYWINIATYPTTTPAVGPSFNITPPTGWFSPMANSNWISARNTYSSGAGTNSEDPGYSIFRKCYCLQQGFKQAQLNFQVRADDKITVWLNTITNQVLAPSNGNFNSATPLSASTATGFRAGKNCIYVLLEDYFGVAMGFDLVGNISAYGLLQTPAKGTSQSFAPCSCAAGATGMAVNADEEQKMVTDIVKMIEARRTKQN